MFVRDSRLAEKLQCLLRIAEKGVGGFCAFELNGFAESLCEVLRDVAHAEKFGTCNIDDKRRRGSVKKRLQAHVVGVRLPDSVEIAHGERHRFAGMNALRDVHEDAIAKFGGVVEAEDRSFDVCGAAEMFEDSFAAEAADGIFADGAEFVGFLGTCARDRRKAVNISGGECSNSAVAETIGD